MWLIDRAREWLDRVEMRLAVRVALVTACVFAAALAVAYVEASDELLEEVERDVARELDSLSSSAMLASLGDLGALDGLFDAGHERKLSLRWLGADGAAVGLDRFGASAPAEVLYERLGITCERVVAEARRLIR